MGLFKKKKVKKKEIERITLDGEKIYFENVEFKVIIRDGSQDIHLDPGSYDKRIKTDRLVVVKKTVKKTETKDEQEDITDHIRVKMVVKKESFVEMDKSVLTCAAIRSLLAQTFMKDFSTSVQTEMGEDRIHRRYRTIRTHQIQKKGKKTFKNAMDQAEHDWEEILKKVEKKTGRTQQGHVLLVKDILRNKKKIVKYDEKKRRYEIRNKKNPNRIDKYISEENMYL
jgi:hypothetical protein